MGDRGVVSIVPSGRQMLSVEAHTPLTVNPRHHSSDVIGALGDRNVTRRGTPKAALMAHQYWTFRQRADQADRVSVSDGVER